jgi:tight adherence protein B
MLANGLKAGLSLQQSFQMLSTDGPSPINEEFALIVGQIKVGKNFEESLIEFKERVSLDDVDILVESILVLRQTGGNLVETFSSIANTIRERQKISGKIRVLTAQGVTQAAIILAMPFALVLGLYFVADWYVLPLITEPLGLFLILVAFCMQGLGAMWLKKIVTIKV